MEDLIEHLLRNRESGMDYTEMRAYLKQQDVPSAEITRIIDRVDELSRNGRKQEGTGFQLFSRQMRGRLFAFLGIIIAGYQLPNILKGDFRIFELILALLFVGYGLLFEFNNKRLEDLSKRTRQKGMFGRWFDR